MRGLIATLGLFSLAFAGPDAVLVVRDQVLEQGRVVEYVGTQRYPVQNEAELELLVGQLNRPASSSTPIRAGLRCKKRVIAWILRRFGWPTGLPSRPANASLCCR
jgi:hypothetical protein